MKRGLHCLLDSDNAACTTPSSWSCRVQINTAVAATATLLRGACWRRILVCCIHTIVALVAVFQWLHACSFLRAVRRFATANMMCYAVHLDINLKLEASPEAGKPPTALHVCSLPSHAARCTVADWPRRLCKTVITCRAYKIADYEP